MAAAIVSNNGLSSRYFLNSIAAALSSFVDTVTSRCEGASTVETPFFSRTKNPSIIFLLPRSTGSWLEVNAVFWAVHILTPRYPFDLIVLYSVDTNVVLWLRLRRTLNLSCVRLSSLSDRSMNMCLRSELVSFLEV